MKKGSKHKKESIEKLRLSKLGKKLSEQHKLNISIAGKGKSGKYIRTKEINQKISEANKGKTSWNKGTKGLQVSWNKGKKGIYSQETLDKMREARIGKPSWNKGISPSKKTKQKISDTLMKGKVIHHLDFNDKNNHPDNLHAFNSQKEHIGYHTFLKDLVKDNLIK